MPDLTVFVAGTGTAVGKTWVAASLAQNLLARGHTVAARKPVQSYAAGERTDSEVLANATGETPDDVCPPHRGLARPLAPPIAARLLGRDGFSVADLCSELHLPRAGIALIEGVGGPRSPVAEDGDNISLATALSPDTVVLVSHSGLGAINDILLGREAFADFRVVAYLNRYDDADEVHRTNREWLSARVGVSVVTSVAGLARAILDEP